MSTQQNPLVFISKKNHHTLFTDFSFNTSLISRTYGQDVTQFEQIAPHLLHISATEFNGKFEAMMNSYTEEQQHEFFLRTCAAFGANDDESISALLGEPFLLIESMERLLDTSEPFEDMVVSVETQHHMVNNKALMLQMGMIYKVEGESLALARNKMRELLLMTEHGNSIEFLMDKEIYSYHSKEELHVRTEEMMLKVGETLSKIQHHRESIVTDLPCATYRLTLHERLRHYTQAMGYNDTHVGGLYRIFEQQPDMLDDVPTHALVALEDLTEEAMQNTVRIVIKEHDIPFVKFSERQMFVEDKLAFLQESQYLIYEDSQYENIFPMYIRLNLDEEKQ